MYKKLLFVASLLAFTMSVKAGDTLRYTLEQCHEFALQNSATARLQSEEVQAAKYGRQAALAAMFPRVSANGGYMWNSRNAHLVGDEHSVGSLGTARIDKDGNPSFDWSSTSWISQQAAQWAGTILEGPIKAIQGGVGNFIAGGYQKLYDALTIDVQHILVAQVGITQPIYLGGRLTQMYKIAKSAEKIANIRSSATHDDLIYKVDEAYWRMVSVAHKKELADQYHSLLCQLESDVTEAVKEGMATQSDLMKVMAKRGEADVKKLQAENGLTLSRMALAQVCGLSLGMAKSSAKLASAGLQPNILASANYIYTNPNAENGLKSDWKGHGFFSAGVVVNVPIAHADAILRYKAAKHAAKVATLKAEETRELLTLQITQANQKLMEAQQKIAMARLNQRNAEEVLRMARESYDAGMVTASELMAAQTAWLSAASEVVDAETEAKTLDTQMRKYLGQL